MFLHGVLVHHQEVVLILMLIVYEVYDACLHLMLCVSILHLYAILHHLRELKVTLIERRTLYLVQFLYSIFYGIKRQRRIDAMQRLLQHIIHYRISIVAHYIRSVLVAVLLTIKALKQLYKSLLVYIF